MPDGNELDAQSELEFCAASANLCLALVTLETHPMTLSPLGSAIATVDRTVLNGGRSNGAYCAALPLQKILNDQSGWISARRNEEWDEAAYCARSAGQGSDQPSRPIGLSRARRRRALGAMIDLRNFGRGPEMRPSWPSLRSNQIGPEHPSRIRQSREQGPAFLRNSHCTLDLASKFRLPQRA